MSRIAVTACCVVVAVACVGCMTAPEVAQGVVVRHLDETAVLVVRDEVPPHAELEFTLADAEVGADLEPGDEVRVAYIRDGDALRATRVMNLSRQVDAGAKPRQGGDRH